MLRFAVAVVFAAASFAVQLAPGTPAVKAGPAAPRPAATGVIKGTVAFDGTPPARPGVLRNSDPYCARTEMLADDVIVTGGKLKDVLVRIKNGSLPAPAPP